MTNYRSSSRYGPRSFQGWSRIVPGMANKISRSMVALSASAIATIYAAGFVLTRSADAGLAASATSASSIPVAASATSQPASTAPRVVVGASAPATAATASGLKDGTYTGQGTSRRGGIGVSLTVQAGAITNVQITSVSTQYPVSRIASL